MNDNYWKDFYKGKSTPSSSSFYNFVRDRVSINDIVLDVGAGDGRDTFPLSVRCKVYTVEPNNHLPWVNFKSIKDVNIIPTIVYARFFFHAVEEEVENDVLDFCQYNRVKLFAEFRTEPVANADHSRRPIDPVNFISKLVDRGYTNIELYIGRFSRYKDDNPLLARIIASYDK